MRQSTTDKLFERSRICGICGLYVVRGQGTTDHIIPRSKGGASNFSNYQLAHFKCNQNKANT